MKAYSADGHHRALEALARAPYEPDLWTDALDLVAQAAGGWATQLLGIGSTGVELHWASGLSADALDEFERVGGAIPGLNPRVTPALVQPVLGVVSDEAYIDAAERARSAFYQGLFRKYDADFVLQGRARDVAGARILVTVVRSLRQGHAQASDIERFAPLLEPLGAALDLQHALDGQAAALAAGSLQALTLAAFLCDAWGRVVGLTAAADALVAQGDVLRLRAGQLQATNPQAAPRLQAAMELVCRAGRHQVPPTPQVVTAHDPGGFPRRIDVAAIPHSPLIFRSTAVAVVLVSAERPSPSAAVLQDAFGLTAAEAQVALGIAQGLTTAEIARRRQVSHATARVQAQTAMQKMGVRKAAVLATVIARLSG